MPWRDTSAFLYTWLALVTLMILARLALEFRLRDPFLEAAYYLSIILYVPPVVATLASLSGPLRGEPLLAFTLGIYTYSASLVPGVPLGLLTCLARRCGSLSWPHVSLALILPAIWGLGCALLASSRRPWDLKALPAYPVLFLAWRYGLGLLTD